MKNPFAKKDFPGKLHSSNIIRRYEGNPLLTAADVPYQADFVFNAETSSVTVLGISSILEKSPPSFSTTCSRVASSIGPFQVLNYRHFVSQIQNQSHKKYHQL